MKFLTTTLGELAGLRNGKAFQPSDWSASGLPIIRIQNLNGSDKPFNYWAGPIDRQVTVKNDDLLLAWSGTPGTSFGAHIWTGADAVLNQHIFRVDLDEKRVTKSWAKFVINFQLRTLIGQAHGGVGLQHVTRPMVEALPIPLPPLAEQRRIAAVLDAAEALRAKRRAAVAKLDSLTQAIFVEMFGDPVLNTKRWPVQRFRDLGSLDRGISTNRPRNAPELLGGPYPLVQTGEIANCGGYVRSYTSTYSEVGLRQSKMWPAGTLCITIAANIAKTGILTFPACFPDSVVGFCAENPATVEYVRVWLSFLQKKLEDNAPESAQKNINLGMLRELRVPVPPIGVCEEFARRLATATKLHTTNSRALTHLDSLFTSLQHRAFCGEL